MKDNSPMGEQQIFNAIVEFFEEDEWDFQWLEGMSVLSMGFSGKSGKWQCYAQARELQQQFVFYSVLPVNVPKEKRAKVAEFITRVNYGMIVGNFEMDFDDGEIRYKTSIDIEGAELIPPLIRQIVYANIIITDRYLNSLMRVIYSEVTPEVAISEADLETMKEFGDLDDDDDFGDDELDDDDDFDAYYIADDDDFDDDDELDDDDFEDEDYDDLDFPPSPNGNSPYSLN
jgi:hypothetical protein